MASLVLTSETLVTTPGPGQKEFNGTIFTGAPTATTRGIIPTEQFYRLNSNLVGGNVTTAQSLFGVGVTLAGSTVYEYEMNFTLVKSSGATSHTLSMQFGGTATLNNIAYIGVGTYAFGALYPQFWSTTGEIIGSFNAATINVIDTVASALAYYSLIVKGTVSINAGGTFIPQYILSAAPGGVYSTFAGSYMKIKPIGVSGENTSVGTWA
jgi:hypothetical protein